MKYLLLSVSFVILFTYRVSAQKANVDSLLQKMNIAEDPGMPIREVINHIGSKVYVRDTICGFKIINRSRRLLFLGGNYPNQVLTIIIKGKKLNKEISFWFKSGIGHFFGKAIIYESKPAIIITSDIQLGTSVMI